ncbi:glycoside hydrolase family 2 TIM barrel-domain containing protein [uncultured Polaribacter sp.]|uniref:glycoside hydrolase family 2 protein n=1 Tax=uncultured Polaribacter sp. TaxID=174711 RepID=UPI0030DBC9EB|tara:strand:- start:11470 stop:13905 length:2436 start_codon:yes stop_codon:yes gene_type:complete
MKTTNKLTSIVSNFTLLFVLMLIITACNSSNKIAESSERTKTNINNNWLYLENDTEQISEAIENKDWQQINLPHSWNSLDATDLDPGYRRSGSWYKKTIDVNINANSIYELYFEGVNITSKIFVNGTKVGTHIGGYIGFTIDISDALKSGENEIIVRVDNSYDPEVIPSQQSDFFIYGGITRDVWLQSKPKTHLANLKYTTPKVSEEKATLEGTVSVINGNTSSKVKAILKDKENKIVAENIFSVDNGLAKISFYAIKNPKLWDTDNPNLYTIEVSLLDENNAEKDKISDKVGFRWFEFKDHGAFFLNGKRLLLRGTHRHEEHAGVGAAMSNEQHRADMELIKEMGTNFVRLAHYPQDPEIYKACDELGLLVWDELPWCRGGVGNDTWKTNTKNMLTEIINQNYNRPSVIIWSLGNEMYWLPDFEDGGKIEKMNSFLTELNDLSHQLDPTRKTAIRKYYEGSDIVDVFSPSIWSGWYSGSYKSYQKAIDQYKKEYKSFLHAEYGGSSHVGRHTENPITGEGAIQADGWEEAIVQTDVANIAQIGDWSENYIVDLFDWHLRISENDSTFVGNIQWAFKDFGTPLRPENAIPYMNQKGLVDRAGNRKDAFYVFKSYWSKDPFTYIESHTWTEREGPQGLARDVSVYSNCKEVELSLNGKSLGTKTRNTKEFPAAGLNWNLQFREGENTLVSSGKTTDGKTVTDKLIINYRFTKNQKAEGLKLSYSVLENGNYLVTAIAFDKNGLRCLDYENRVYFQCLSGGETMKSLGTPTGSESIEMANGKASIEVKRNSKNKPLEMMVLNQNFKGTYLTVQ